MKYISLLNSDMKVIVDDEDFDKLINYNWSISFANGFVTTDTRRNEKKEKLFMHLFILDEPPKISNYETVVRHNNGNKLDNRKENLKHVSVSLRNQNRNRVYKNKTSRFKGVCWHKTKNVWKAYASIKGKHKHLGYYNDEIEAAIAYNRFCGSVYGLDAKINDVNAPIKPVGEDERE